MPGRLITELFNGFAIAPTDEPTQTGDQKTSIDCYPLRLSRRRNEEFQSLSSRTIRTPAVFYCWKGAPNLQICTNIKGAQMLSETSQIIAFGLFVLVSLSLTAAWILFSTVRKPQRLCLGLSAISNFPSSGRQAMRPEVADVYLRRLDDLMDCESLYLDGDLTLADVAKRLCTSPQNLSEALNGRLGQHFGDYINKHRIAEVQKLLLDPRSRHRSIIALAFEAGFNSKTAFNGAFRRTVGITPSEFRTQAVSTIKDDSSVRSESMPFAAR
jgi:AraC-like DNA-binding protein